MHIESQSHILDEQREQIQGLEQTNRVLSERLQSHEESAQSKIEALNKKITELKEIVHEYRHSDHEMSDALAIDIQTKERLGEVTESYCQITPRARMKRYFKSKNLMDSGLKLDSGTT